MTILACRLSCPALHFAASQAVVWPMCGLLGCGDGSLAMVMAVFAGWCAGCHEFPRLPDAGMPICPFSVRVCKRQETRRCANSACALGRDGKQSLKSSNHREVLSAGQLGVVLDTFTTDSGAIRKFYYQVVGSAPRSSQLRVGLATRLQSQTHHLPSAWVVSP